MSKKSHMLFLNLKGLEREIARFLPGD